jgi:hypothetical protein
LHNDINAPFSLLIVCIVQVDDVVAQEHTVGDDTDLLWTGISGAAKEHTNKDRPFLRPDDVSQHSG